MILRGAGTSLVVRYPEFGTPTSEADTQLVNQDPVSHTAQKTREEKKKKERKIK